MLDRAVTTEKDLALSGSGEAQLRFTRKQRGLTSTRGYDIVYDVRQLPVTAGEAEPRRWVSC